MKQRLRLRLNHWLNGLLWLLLAGLLAWLSTRYPLEADWTDAGRHTLSRASIEILDQLESPLEITPYARPQAELREIIRRFVARYQRASDKVVVEDFVNPDAVPDEVRNLGLSVNGELVLRYEGRVETVKNDSEEQFANAVQRLLRGSERWIAFLDGHDERSPVGDTDHDLSQWARQLKQRGINFQPLNLGATHAIPDNTSVLVIAGPRSRLLDGEIAIIRSFLEAGGNLLWLVEPGDQFGLETVAEFLGLEFLNGIVIDIATQLLGINDPTVAVMSAGQYGNHPALEGFGLTTLFPHSIAMRATGSGDWSVKPLLVAGRHTWVETGSLEGEVEYEPGFDIQGPLNLAMALTREVGKEDGAVSRQRIVVVGDGDFLANAYLGNGGNLELGVRLVNWLTEDESFIRIPARGGDDTVLEMDDATLGIFGVFFLLVLPAGLLATGAWTWWRRRRL